MSLEHDIVIRNEFTNTSYSTRGATPGKFTEEYMARNDATLTTYPVNNTPDQTINVEDPDNVYQTQKDLLLSRRTSFNKKRPTKENWLDLTTLEGRSFSQDGLSLSKGMIDQTAKKMQQAWNNGHTVMKIVASFDNDYLKRKKVEKPNATDFHQDVDEYKLRMSVQKGCQALGKSLGYARPLFIGTIQLDRDHPHAHIAMCETANPKMSKTKYFYDGHEWGTLTKNDKNKMRQAINNDLTNNLALNFYPSNQVEQAQKATEQYSDHFATLRQQKQLISLNVLSTQKEDRISELMIEDLSDSLALKSNQHTNKIRKKLRRNLANSAHKTFKLPALLNLQLQSLQALKKSALRSAKIMRRLKEHKRQEKLAKRRETKLKNQYQALLKLQADHPEKALAIKAYFLPFYQTALINSAKKVDQARLYQYQPMQKVPSSAYHDFANLKVDLAISKTPFEKAETKQRTLNTLVYWHQRGWVNYHQVQMGLKKIDYQNLPLPRRSGVNSLSRLDRKQLKQGLGKDMLQEHYLAVNAAKGLKDLNNSFLKYEIKQTLKEEVKDLKTGSPKSKPVKEVPKIVQHYSINYQKADDELLDSVN